MNTTREAVDSLRNYAIETVGELVARDDAVRPILESLEAMASGNIAPTQPLSDSQARAMTKHAWDFADASQADSEVFSDEEIEHVEQLARMVLQLAVAAGGDTTELQEAVDALYPFLSQDSRTEPIGFDLQEYMDWYFEVADAGEREKYMHQLLHDWGMEDTEQLAEDFEEPEE